MSIVSGIALTPAASARVKYLMEKQGNPGLYLRVGVRGGGCSGFTYTLNLEPTPCENDARFEIDGINIIVDPKSRSFLEGTTIDYRLDSLLSGGFAFQNPNAAKTCGCGSSFQPAGRELKAETTK
ncbi:MAG: iron-sulfur cluster assembly accessory protein [Armatimonadetes bacterium]|nr:iron-sulfur cluster assembly accessory protein [Armatimonadota bacterium]